MPRGKSTPQWQEAFPLFLAFYFCIFLFSPLFYRRFCSYLEFLTLPPSVLSLFLPILLVAIKFKNLREEQDSLRSSMDPKIH